MTQTDCIAQACEELKKKHVIGLPTETVYGLAADATCDESVAHIYAYKQRPRFHPLISHVSSIDMACAIGQCDPEVLNHIWIKNQWSLTVIVNRLPGAHLSWLTTAGLKTVAMRYPQHKLARDLIADFAKPLAAPSANIFGQLSPVAADHVRKYWPDVYVLDGGVCRVGLESTIIDLTQDKPVLLRSGATPREDLLRVWPTLTCTNKADTAAPGTLKKHYQTSIPLYMNQSKAKPGGVFVGFNAIEGDVNLSQDGSVVAAAARLFQLLHELDCGQYSSISIAPIPNQGLGEAINDRLKRASCEC